MSERLVSGRSDLKVENEARLSPRHSDEKIGSKELGIIEIVSRVFEEEVSCSDIDPFVCVWIVTFSQSIVILERF